MNEREGGETDCLKMFFETFKENLEANTRV